MYSNLNLDNKLINDNVIKILLKYDFTIYGCFVREVLFDNLIIFDYQKKKNNIINVFGPKSQKVFLEKMLKYNIDSSETISEPTNLLNKCMNTNYIVNIQDILFNLDVIYVDDLYLDNISKFKNNLKIVIDIDTICLKKNSLSVLNIDKFLNKTLPLIEVIKKINNNSFNILFTNLTKEDKIYIKNLLKNGYKNLDKKIKDCLLEYDCPICYDKNDKDYSQLSCGHIFHTKCLNQAIDVEIIEKEDESIFRCPYCNKNFFIYEVI